MNNNLKTNFEFIFASSNQHKFLEFEDLFKNSCIKLQLAEKSLEVTEDGDSYHQNALLKAKAYFNHQRGRGTTGTTPIPIMADDSGLNVLSLPNELGIHSARFGGDGLNYNDRCKLLLEKLNNLENVDRSAYFVCVLCFYFSDQEIFFFEGRLEGKIGSEIKGSGGFGFDPIFIPSSATKTTTESPQSLAEMDEWKQLHSHRAVAAKEAMKFFAGRSFRKSF
ncbi:MAG: non-canonical purine NTP pyrophosphatase [Oligoflexia bacterium]|nr:non-canonical purine NTP pyrophosphatase [Oligoflexia bacterium]